MCAPFPHVPYSLRSLGKDVAAQFSDISTYGHDSMLGWLSTFGKMSMIMTDMLQVHILSRLDNMELRGQQKELFLWQPFGCRSVDFRLWNG